MVSLTIDGVEVSVPKGTSVMRAAAENGMNIPNLCATDSLEPFGSCRLCTEWKSKVAAVTRHRAPSAWWNRA